MKYMKMDYEMHGGVSRKQVCATENHHSMCTSTVYHHLDHLYITILFVFVFKLKVLLKYCFVARLNRNGYEVVVDVPFRKSYIFP